MRNRQMLYLSAILVLSLAMVALAANVPQEFNFQGLLQDSGGQPVTSPVSVLFSIYDVETGGTALWSETRSVSPDAQGRFSISLGQSVPITDDILSAPSRWLGVKVEDDEEMSNRSKLASSPYSFRISTVDGAKAGTIQGALTVEADAQALQKGSSAAAVDASLMLLGNQSEIIEMSPGTGVILRATNENGDEVLSTSIDSQDHTASMMVRGPGGDEEAVFGATGVGFSSTANGSVSLGTSGNSLEVTDSDGDVRVTIAIDGNESKVIVHEKTGVARLAGESATTPKLEFSSQGLLMFGASASDTVAMFLPNGDIFAKGQLVMGQNFGTLSRSGSAAVPVGAWSTVLGFNNLADGDSSAVGGGYNNIAYNKNATISGGSNNQVGVAAAKTADYPNAVYGGQTIGGGAGNSAFERYTSIGGGSANQASIEYSTIAGGFQNSATGQQASIGGGFFNSADGSSATIGGGYGNTTSDGFPTISGGQTNTAGSGSAVGGGSSNTALTNSTVGGGQANQAIGDYSTTGGGLTNLANNLFSAISGGANNTASGPKSFVGAGDQNTASGNASTVTGGSQNTASGSASAIGGGEHNETAAYSTVAGGTHNKALGHYSGIPGGQGNSALGTNSFVAGSWGRANHAGSMVLSANWHNTDADSVSTGGNGQMVMFAEGAMYLTNTPEVAPYDNTNIITTNGGAYLSGNGTNWTNSSDRNQKENFTALDRERLLEKIAALEITQWNYKSEDNDITHIGPVAQDFHALFGVGGNDKSISTVDPAGIALAAIQELHAVNKELQVQVAELQALVQKLLAERE